MKWNALSEENCSLARTLAVVGDRWSLLILRDAFLRVRRFEDFESSLKIARRVLAERLAHLAAEGVLTRVPYQERPIRYEYRLTEKGLALYPALIALVHWGDHYYADENGPPIIHRHRTCGHDFRSVMTCGACGEALDPRDVDVRPGRLPRSPANAIPASRSRSRKAATRSQTGQRQARSSH